MLKKLNPLFWVLLALAFFCLSLAVAARFAAPASVTLSFTVEGNVTQLELAPGETPDVSALETAGEGLRFVCWLDEEGLEARPEVPAHADAAYTALIAPALAGDGLEPWLDCGEYGRALPDEPISGQEAAAGLSAAFAGGLEAGELSGLSSVCACDLAAALEGAFAPGELDWLEGEEPLTRIQAAQLICKLSGAQAPEYSGRAAAPDLDPAREGAAELLRCLRPEGLAAYEDGFLNLDGWLYCVEDGLFLTNTEVQGIAFGPDGRYSSGSAELDALVAETLAPICAEYGSREEMLRAAYLYVRDSFTYLRRNYYEVGADGWQTQEALTMFRTGRGNCYCYAAAFCALARGLGYDAQAVAGTVGRNCSPHGWVIMYDAEGTRIVYDVELEMAYIYNRRILDADLYAMDPLRASQLVYIYGGQAA